MSDATALIPIIEDDEVAEDERAGVEIQVDEVGGVDAEPSEEESRVSCANENRYPESQILAELYSLKGKHHSKDEAGEDEARIEAVADF